MKYAADFRSIARDALRGRWVVAVIAGVIAALLGGLSSGGPEVNFEYSDNGAPADGDGKMFASGHHRLL